MEVVYDTGSDWLTVEGSNCGACQGNLYSYHDSSSFAYITDNNTTVLNYGSASFKGKVARDQVCFARKARSSDQFEI